MSTAPVRPSAVILAIACSALVAIAGCDRTPTTDSAQGDTAAIDGEANGPWVHRAFVWQRRWTPEVEDAVRRAPGYGLRGLVALAAELEHRDDGPRTVRIPVDLAALAAAGDPALALRIGGSSRAPYPRAAVAEVAAELTEGARRAGHPLRELHIDHDCPTRRLPECAELLEAVRRRIAPTPLVFTALPSWLGAPDAFAGLAAVADGFVLQVHSLDDPGRQGDLVDPALARRAVDAAATFGRPFHVALPTHTYRVFLDAEGRTVDVAAEGRGPSIGGPPARRRLVASDPASMAALVRGWLAARPPQLEGILWFRLPVETDRYNWTAATLAGVIEGQAPVPRLAVEVRRPEPGLAEIDLVNRGDGAVGPPARVRLDYPKPPLAGDGLGGYRFDLGRGLLEGAAGAPLRPGERRAVAWLRFQSPETPVSATFGDPDAL